MSDNVWPPEAIASRPCELCGAEHPSTLFRVDGYALVRCRECALVYVGDPPDEAALAELYDEAYWEEPEAPGYAGYADQAERKRHHARTLLARMDAFREPGTLLEIGCAYGFFLDEARKRGWIVNGVEPSETAADHASKELDLDVFPGSLESVELAPGSFDAVVMWDVIEHLPTPAGTLRRVRDLLRPGGLFALSTGDVGSLSARLQGRRWSLFTPPWHLFFFSAQTLRGVIEACGLELLAMDGDGVVGADPYAEAERLPAWLSGVATSRLATALGRAMGAGMIKYAYARKPLREREEEGAGPPKGAAGDTGVREGGPPAIRDAPTKGDSSAGAPAG